MIVAVGLLGPLPRSDNPSQATYTLGTCQTSMMCCQRCGQIFVRSWISCPYKTQYQCSILQWGTVFTNDCCSRLVGTITKVRQVYSSNICTKNMSDINDVLPKSCGQIFVRSWISCPYKTQYQCTILQWGTVFPNDCCSRLVGSITKVWQPFTSNMHPQNMSDINDVLPRMWPDFCRILNFLSLQDWISVQHLAMRHCIPQWLLQ